MDVDDAAMQGGGGGAKVGGVDLEGDNLARVEVLIGGATETALKRLRGSEGGVRLGTLEPSAIWRKYSSWTARVGMELAWGTQRERKWEMWRSQVCLRSWRRG